MNISETENEIWRSFSHKLFTHLESRTPDWFVSSLFEAWLFIYSNTMQLILFFMNYSHEFYKNGDMVKTLVSSDTAVFWFELNSFVPCNMH